MIQVGDTVRVKAPDDGREMSEGWRGSIGWVGTVHEIGRGGPDSYTVTFGENATDGFWTYPACGLERVEPEALAADDDTTITVSSGNPYADLGLANPEQRLAEARKRIAQRHDPVGNHLAGATMNLRAALAVAAVDASQDRLVALTELIGHVDRCVRELPE